MLKHLMNTKALKMAGFAIAIGLVTAVVSVPAWGAKEEPLTKSEFRNLVANAEKPADQERIALYFDAEASKYEAEAKEHAELAPFYQRSPDPALSKHPGSQRSFQHC